MLCESLWQYHIHDLKDSGKTSTIVIFFRRGLMRTNMGRDMLSYVCISVEKPDLIIALIALHLLVPSVPEVGLACTTRTRSPFAATNSMAHRNLQLDAMGIDTDMKLIRRGKDSIDMIKTKLEYLVFLGTIRRQQEGFVNPEFATIIGMSSSS